MNIVRSRRTLGQSAEINALTDPFASVSTDTSNYVMANAGQPGTATYAPAPEPTDWLGLGPISPAAAEAANYPTIPASQAVPQPSPVSVSYNAPGPTLPPGPSPRVSSTPTTNPFGSLSSILSTKVAGIPVVALFGGVLVLSMLGGGRRRRR